MYFKDHLLANINKLVYLSEIAQSIKHHGIHGRLKEIVIEELIKPYLPSYMNVCSGKVINSLGEESSQIDIIIYVPDIIPPALLKQDIGLIPVESVLATLEVKSKLTSTKLKEGILNGVSIKNLDFHPAVRKEHSDFHNIPSYLFSYSSDLTEIKKTECDRIKESVEKYGIDNRGQIIHAPISGVCILNKAFIKFEFHDEFSKGDPKRYQWIQFNSVKGSYEEVIYFISSVIDQCTFILDERKRIPLKPYLFDK